MPKRIIYWFRNDLRLHDNEGFFKATQDAEEVIPVYVFDTVSYTHLDVYKRQGLRFIETKSSLYRGRIGIEIRPNNNFF